MPIHASEEGWNLIKKFKKKMVKPLLNKVHGNYEEIANERIEEGWKRSSTSEIREEILDIIGHLDEDKSIRKFLDIFLVIYDSDNAYAQFFHHFVNKCNEGKLNLDPGKSYMNYEKGSEEWWEYEKHEQENMSEEELENLRKRTK